MRITSNRPDADNRLFSFLERGLAGLGARVEVTDDDNLVRRVGRRRVISDPLPLFPALVPLPTVVVRVEGLANLLHEVGHLMLARVLDDDHGIDYRAIPFDLATEAGRAVLFEELACCTLSCGYPRPLSDSHAWAWADAWFAEQLEIQPVFYGLEETPDRFWDRVAEVYRAHAEACEATVDRAFSQTEALLRWAGAPVGVAAPPQRLSFRTLLRRARPAEA
ncbi:MAG: hypothetical protein KUG77_24360 [Nannocystaceae bacterium]|nr:hypothetical protein [Nannocystaceae bacterium]